ncbi:alpha/beta fold hydrolase [Nocardiopsis sp. N85]|uniref:alpha/beta hydrolase family protein n=1 Tax=Nocardiopsis sp. N85 TaxID=3029400 RepID=UPI00237FBC4D|nr:alpha/beta hydrolase [Nocardiopsis sp. N85]MDE3722676.1 alpha/beta fold hydrolase [Nocardiopsis sp. N85]
MFASLSSSRSARGRATAAAVAVTLVASTCACTPTAEEETAPQPGVTGLERELSFTVDGLEVFATLTLPEDVSGPVPGALIISGSGPTDRDGNGDMRPEANTNLNFARLLAEAGVASLRYDKLGSGETGMGDLDPDDPVDPGLFEAQVTAAYTSLVDQREVDPDRTAVVGHSEGSLYALRAHELVDAEPALILAAPVGNRYLDLLDRQLTEQVRTLEAQGGIAETEAVTLLSDARAGRAAVRGGRAVPDDLSGFIGSLYSRQNADFLASMDALDPVELAGALPADTPVLVLWGEADAQVSREDVDRLMTGLPDAERVDVPEADHIFRIYEDEPGATVLDSERPLAPQVGPALTEFVDSAW